ncbi:UbiA prenyltransferase family-domain-containing protein [Cyathus striatus]|nr:UbiA prenyltransferase family-domain-containing protein [Cyathus striatus]
MFLFAYILREVDVFFSFTWRDWSSTFIPGIIFAVGAVRGLSIQAIINNYLFLFLWIAHYLYFFNLSNQITGVVEDGIDKKDRPIPSGKVTLEGAKARWIIIFTSFLAIAIYMPTILPETIVSIMTTAFLCITPGGKHWFGKNNIAMTMATWALLNASWKSIAPHTYQSQIWVHGMAIRTGIMMHIQDIRDIKGDAASGRKTMSIALGDWTTRLLISFLFTPLSMFILHMSHILEVAPWSITISHLVVAYRVLQINGSHYDHKTYMVFHFFHNFHFFCISDLHRSSTSRTFTVGFSP